MEKDTFVFCKRWRDRTKDLPREVRLEIFDGIVDYATSGNVPDLKPVAAAAFSFIRPEIDQNTEKYMNIVRRNRENGEKGGRPKKETQQNPKNPMGYFCEKQNPKNLDICISTNVDILSTAKAVDSSEKPFSELESPPDDTKIDWKAFVDFFNEHTKGIFGTIRHPIGDKRKQMIAARMKKYGKHAFVEMLDKALASDFLQGQSSKGWVASLDWLIKPINFEKVLSGNYDNHKTTETTTPKRKFISS